MTEIQRVKRTMDGWLFLVGGSNSVMDICSDSGFSMKVNVSEWITRLSSRSKRLSQLGCKYRMLIVPEKLSAIGMLDQYQNEIFGRSERYSPPGEKFVELAKCNLIVYPLFFMRDQYKNGYQIYPFTDSHWTWRGALSAFQFLMASLQYKFKFENYLSTKKPVLIYKGDLWEAQFDDVRAEKFEKFEIPSWIYRIYANSLVGFKELNGLTNSAGLHSGSHCIFINDKPETEDCVVIFGSSFSDYRLKANMMTALFASHFRVVHFIWSTEIDYDYLMRIKPDLVVSEIPERFLTICPQDNLNIEEFSASRIRRWKELNHYVNP